MKGISPLLVIGAVVIVIFGAKFLGLFSLCDGQSTSCTPYSGAQVAVGDTVSYAAGGCTGNVISLFRELRRDVNSGGLIETVFLQVACSDGRVIENINAIYVTVASSASTPAPIGATPVPVVVPTAMPTPVAIDVPVSPYVVPMSGRIPVISDIADFLRNLLRPVLLVLGIIV